MSTDGPSDRPDENADRPPEDLPAREPAESREPEPAKAPLRRGEVDRCGLGVIDQRAKEFSPSERRIAEYLAVKGPAVVSVSEGFQPAMN